MDNGKIYNLGRRTFLHKVSFIAKTSHFVTVAPGKRIIEINTVPIVKTAYLFPEDNIRIQKHQFRLKLEKISTN